MTRWLAAFVWTVGLELPVYALAIRRAGQNWRWILMAVLALNLVTHPAVWLWSRAHPAWGWSAWWKAEAAVVAAEALLLGLAFKAPAPRAALAALLANGLSAGAGLLLF